MHVRSVLIAISVFTIVNSGSAMACGESLYRVGKGVAFREYTAPLPGTILIVAKDDNERLLADALLRAGHNVEVVADATSVRDKVNAGRFDIVLSRFEHSDTVDSALQNGGVDYLPVARHGTDEQALAAARYTRTLSDADNIKKFLIQIHRTLKTRQS